MKTAAASVLIVIPTDGLSGQLTGAIERTLLDRQQVLRSRASCADAQPRVTHDAKRQGAKAGSAPP